MKESDLRWSDKIKVVITYDKQWLAGYQGDEMMRVAQEAMLIVLATVTGEWSCSMFRT